MPIAKIELTKTFENIMETRKSQKQETHTRLMPEHIVIAEAGTEIWEFSPAEKLEKGLETNKATSMLSIRKKQSKAWQHQFSFRTGP